MQSTTPSTPAAPARVVILRQRGAAADEMLSRTLEVELTKAGFAVFVDRPVQVNLNWAREIGQKLKEADAVIALVSDESASSEFLIAEVETAHDSAQDTGQPKLFWVRVAGIEDVPEPLSTYLTGLPAFQWRNPDDNTKLVQQLARAIREIPVGNRGSSLRIAKGLRLSPRTEPANRPAPPQPAAPSVELPPPRRIDSAGGAVPLHSPYYVERPADTELRNAIIRYDSIVLLKGARQMGKTSMMARGLQFARERGAKVALTDFQKFNNANLENVGLFYLTMAESLADQLEIDILPADTWDERRGPNANFERFVRREILGKLNAPLVWGLDEVDRLFTTPFGSEVFGLFRSWHNERALDPSGPWAGLTLVIAYATEAHLFITDINQSPFNIGTRLALEDFTAPQVADLNKRYGGPLKTPQEVDRYMALVGGHPFLARRGLYELSARNLSLDAFTAVAVRDDGCYGEHLRRMLVLLARDSALTDVMRGVLRGQPCPSQESFYRLRSAGLIRGDSPTEARPRCQLYAQYLKEHLL